MVVVRTGMSWSRIVLYDTALIDFLDGDRGVGEEFGFWVGQAGV